MNAPSIVSQGLWPNLLRGTRFGSPGKLQHNTTTQLFVFLAQDCSVKLYVCKRILNYSVLTALRAGVVDVSHLRALQVHVDGVLRSL